MNIYDVELAPIGPRYDVEGKSTLAAIRELGVDKITDVRHSRVFRIAGSLDREEVACAAERLLIDPVIERLGIDEPLLEQDAPEGARVVVVARKPGVMDPVEASTIKGLKDLGFEVSEVRQMRKYLLIGAPSENDLRLVASKTLANEVIEEVFEDALPPKKMAAFQPAEFRVNTAAILDADDGELQRISRDGQLFLNLREMQAIREHFLSLGRNPTDVELETIAQTWSEHCAHKTLKGIINYNGKIIDNLLATTVARVTRELDLPWCVSVFEDNAGAIDFDRGWCVTFKVETHNHPSAIEPYGGAGTGIGGVIRDTLGMGMGAKPILNTDIFCFGHPDIPFERVPKGALHPRRVMKGVVAGVRDYGNRMGIPTSNGALYFDNRFIGNPLVYCGSVGVIPRDKVFKQPREGDVIVMAGGRTGRDGIHGATFSSGELTETSEVVSSGAVQIGNAIEEKKLLDTVLKARDLGLFSAITDCGAGGLSSAIGEMGEHLGAEVRLEGVPLKYEGLSYTEIWISEAQERMVMAVPPDKVDEIVALFESENVEATVLGHYGAQGRLKLFYRGQQVADLDMEFMHHGCPRYERKAVFETPRHEEPLVETMDDYGGALRSILAAPNVASKEWVIRQYDHEVQGGSVLKPLVGLDNDGPSDATCIRPLLDSTRGLVISCGLNPHYSDIDPYWMAANAIDEAVRQILAAGGSLDRCALLDNFCWGNTDKPDRLGGLVRAALACYDIGKAYGTPFISGKDSLNNEFATSSGTVAIPGCLLISAMAVIENLDRIISMDLKAPGNAVYLAGKTRRELGSSHYFSLLGAIGNDVPKVRPEESLGVFQAFAEATKRRLVASAHDLSEGGLAVAAAEMAFAGGLGLDIELGLLDADEDAKADHVLLFAESASRLLAEVTADNEKDFVDIMAGQSCRRIGRVTPQGRLTVKGLSGQKVVDEDIEALRKAWKSTFDW